MTRNKQSWLARLEKADRKVQRRLALEGNNDTEVVFKETKSRSRIQTTEERLRISTRRIYGFFIIQIFLFSWLVYASSGALKFDDVFITGFILSIILSILTIIMIPICMYTLTKYPKSYFLYFVLLSNYLLAFYILTELT